jgi:hypothetical protein
MEIVNFRCHPITAVSGLVSLSILRLRSVLSERKPPIGHFDEKQFVCRSGGCLRQSNALGGVVA